MRMIALVLMMALPVPLAAQTADPAPSDDGYSLFEEGAKLMFRGLMQEMEPALDEMGRALQEMEPALREMGPRLRELVDLMGDVANYEAPERMPNGDILIRRKPGAPPPPAVPGAADPQGEVEL
jgi:hypothetical protein